MCGITGIVSFTDTGESFHAKINDSVSSLNQRGPDSSGTFNYAFTSLGHARLSILDTSDAAAQPFSDSTERYTLVYNGEFYNYKELRQELERDGISFKSSGDTEVLLQLYIKYKEKALDKINGFFAFAIYDKKEKSTFIARDRFGIKPLLIFKDEDKLIFASEMKALMAYGIEKDIDHEALYTYLQLNYIPAPHSIFKGVKKLTPGNYIIIKDEVEEHSFYKISDHSSNYSSDSYEQAQKKTMQLLDDSVQKRLISDVPLGGFLSGGIDSSVITALASKHDNNFSTFSIGFKDNQMFDETHYARLVAQKFKTNHTEFILTNDELYESLQSTLDYIDEPFADSSALAVNLLSKYTRQHAKVALSGDGADELFSGYNKHKAEFEARNLNLRGQFIKQSGFIWDKIPQSRGSKIGNLARQLSRFSEGLKLSSKDRYWKWASFNDQSTADDLLLEPVDKELWEERKSNHLETIKSNGDFNDVLRTDMQLVLTNDMLHKVDMMSMANSLEVRTPFLDHELVNYIFTLSPDFKINREMRKVLLQDTFRSILPSELYNRPKKGFEVPLLNWFQNDLKDKINNELLEDSFVKDQNVFNPTKVQQLKAQLFSNNPGAIESQIWGLIVFQSWWKKWME
ncbi:MAG: asparagine synthase (glutamine-hydrolyzing) [Flavobacteriales bacterium]|nr:asparagine synthase (glutamine-hydrolyzing) [Flavobacteriales bacterium]